MIVKYPNGDTYDGDVTLVNNFFLPHGHGKKTFNNGDVQTGNFVYGSLNGQGCYESLNGDSYKGTYRDNMPDGEGESYQANTQRRYKGGFTMGVEDGYAVITTAENAANRNFKRYEGEVRNGKRHGRGKLYLKQADGEIASLDGIWVNDLLHGPGSQISPTGQCFKGTFVNGLLQGPGTCKNADDGETYDVIFTGGIVTRWVKVTET